MVVTYPCQPDRTWNILDASKLKDYLRCPRYYFFRHILGWKPASANHHLVFGESWHAAIAHLWENGFQPNRFDEAAELFLEIYRRDIPDVMDQTYYPKVPGVALKALYHYALSWAPVIHRYRVEGTELGFVVPISDTATLVGRIDRLVLDQTTGLYVVVEAKTGSRKTEAWLNKWSTDFQISTYTHALYCLYPPEECYGVVVDGAFFYKREPSLDWFEQIPIKKTTEDQKLWLTLANLTLNRISDDMRKLADSSPSDEFMSCFLQNPTACEQFSRLCEYHPACSAWPNPLQSQDRLLEGFEVSFWDPRSLKTKKVIDLLPTPERKEVNQNA